VFEAKWYIQLKEKIHILFLKSNIGRTVLFHLQVNALLRLVSVCHFMCLQPLPTQYRGSLFIVDLHVYYN